MIDEAFEFITLVFTRLTARDFYIICREYNILDDEDKEKLKERLIQVGWILNEDGSMDN